MSDIHWITFGSLEIFFGHSKTHQLGDNSKYPRHIFANPSIPLVCPVLALSMYFCCCFNLPQTHDMQLFPGNLQHDHFKNCLERVLVEHSESLLVLGYQPGDIGTHSIHKGATTFVLSLPGGPPLTAVCIQGRWMMGSMKDIYMRYASVGDEFVSCCLCLSQLLQAEFGVSPPHFSDWVADDVVQQLVVAQFPMIHQIDGFGKLCWMCVASTMFHLNYLIGLPLNHVVRVASQVLRQHVTVEFFNNNEEAVRTTMPWKDHHHHFSGIPPHVAALHDLMVVRDEQQLLVDKFIKKKHLVLDERGIKGGHLTVHQLQEILGNGLVDIHVRLDQIEGGCLLRGVQEQEVACDLGQPVNNSTYTPHCHHGGFYRVPADWRFPRVGVLDAWRHWWIGDSVWKIPPLRLVTSQDVKWLEKVPLDEGEMHGRTRQARNKRRPPRKTLGDLRFLMEHMVAAVRVCGAYCCYYWGHRRNV
ncbi:hypothetical protein ACA910_000392 [Epithemia clementina (nom. ined.)]